VLIAAVRFLKLYRYQHDLVLTKLPRFASHISVDSSRGNTLCGYEVPGMILLCDLIVPSQKKKTNE